ncbi:LPS-assembly protein LptD [Helicobacter sp. T3_23-1056]
MPKYRYPKKAIDFVVWHLAMGFCAFGVRGCGREAFGRNGRVRKGCGVRFFLLCGVFLVANVLADSFDTTNMRGFNLGDESLAQSLKSQRNAQGQIQDATPNKQIIQTKTQRATKSKKYKKSKTTYTKPQRYTKLIKSKKKQNVFNEDFSDLGESRLDFSENALEHKANETNQNPQNQNSTKSTPPLPITPASKTAAKEYDKDNQRIFELLADEVKSENNIVYAINNAVMINPDLYTIADVIKYDLERKKVYASGDVRIYRGESLLVRTHSASFELDDKYGIIEPLYLQDTTSGMWVNATSATSKQNLYSFKKATISGCQVQSPIWRIEASSGSYNADKERISMWNPRVYIGDVPIFYFPFFTIDTNLNRKAGLLMPYFISSSTEGFIYAQPYFVPVKSWFDMTFTPQIRTSRGVGGQFEMRFVDSANDRTYAEAGYMYNFDSYKDRYNIKNREVYGFRFFHLGKQPFQKYFKLKNELDNGIYVNMVHMNDLDYYRFDKANKRIYDATYASKANFYLQSDNHYFGINIKYFLNLSKLNNASTFQSVPNLQYHKYTNSLFWNWLLYSIDYQMKNTIRARGYGYVENALKIPIGFQFSLFKKYVSIGFWNEFYAENLVVHSANNSYMGGSALANTALASEASQIPNELKYGNIFSANYSLSLNTDLSRSFNKIFHTIQFETLFSGPYPNVAYTDGLFDRNISGAFSSIKAAGLGNRSNANLSQNINADFANTFPFFINGAWRYYDDIWDPSGISAYSVLSNTLDMKLTQHFITNNGRHIFDWRIFQKLNFDELELESNRINGKIETKNIAKRPLENRFSLTPIDGLNISTSFFYSFYYNALSEISASLSYNVGSFSSLISYYFKDGGLNRGYDLTSNTLTTNTGAHYLRGVLSKDFGVFALSAQVGYDVEKNFLLDWDIGIYKNVRCFGIGLRFVNRRRPILTNNEKEPFFVQNDYFVRIVFNFVPLGGSGLSMRF